MKKQIIVLLLICSCQLAHATIYYVSMKGSDTNNGTSLETAFATIQKAHDESNPGDTILVADGTYMEEVIITRSGNDTSGIVYKSINKWGAKITNSKGNCFTIKASYITIDGFDLMAPSIYGSGVAVMPVKNGVYNHHITAVNNKCHDSGDAGISAWDCDYIAIENNICYKNAWLMPSCGSGISIYGRYTFDKDSSKFHYIVRGNICYLNDNGPTTRMTDGNGIIIDDLRNTQTSGHHGLVRDLNYTGQAVLVENNLCYANGGKGIHTCWSNNITLRNNTVYGNCTRADQQKSNWNADLSCDFASNVIAVNNICVSTVPNNNAHGIFAGAGKGIGIAFNLTFYNNITYSTFSPVSPAAGSEGITIAVKGVNGNLCATDPLLINPGNSEISDFHLKPKSPAINKGTSKFGNADVDLYGNQRVVKGKIDIGACEYGSAPKNAAGKSSKRKSTGRVGSSGTSDHK